MKRVLFFVIALAVSQGVFAQANLDITLKHDTADEVRTRDQLRRLLATYDLSPWIYTTSIVIDERAIPFSHPVLTLHSRHAKDDDLLLSTFVHEQFHWFLAERREPTELAIADLRKLFPTVPAGGTAGARDEYSTYLHLLVCYLEQQADVSAVRKSAHADFAAATTRQALAAGGPPAHDGPRLKRSVRISTRLLHVAARQISRCGREGGSNDYQGYRAPRHDLLRGHAIRRDLGPLLLADL